ncbi:GNAT family N-acetyltransferase [Vibrio cincinnatiensis]|uniref:GNAT family N-acetyltransferase n=1 Tax=Vibrio cincinnatiensis TaxID=675 RepID=UPI001EE07FA0|nr:GNAT family N-acetyltransferase [Vibrio cincinnatiensis]MCG3731624.1 GNAT family N-acetyltransferase [Vibrio cincinnatiensis]MCG3738392.1 GNAT family N-acetyltransferase [Vibrio cincinnatiensis]
MTYIHYRKAVEQDFETIANMFATNMDLSVFTSVKDTDTLKHLATIFVAGDVMRSTFTEIAEHDGKICGVILGSTRMTHEKAVEFDYKGIVKQTKVALQTTASGQQLLRELKQQQKSFGQMPEHDCNSELLFFCVDNHYRRHQIGTTLVKAFECYLSDMNAKGYSLHTDNKCSYQYYEKNGYQRIDTRKSIYNPQVEHYTYIKTFV